MDLPPPLPPRAHRFEGVFRALRIVLCAATLGAAVSAVMNDALMEWTLVPLSAIHAKILDPPLNRDASRLVAAVKVYAMFRALGVLLSTLLFGFAGCAASIYLACRWQTTRGAMWLCGYTVGGTGLLMFFGFGLRCLVGDRAVFGGDHAPNGLPGAYFICWPVLFLALGGCYVGLTRQTRLPAERSVPDERVS